MPYYHVYIHEADEVYELDFSKEKLEECIVEPYLTGKEFMCGGSPIDPFEVEKIKISRTEQPSSALISRIKAKPDFVSWIGVETYVVDEGIDVTREFITHPPIKQKKTLIRKKHQPIASSLSKDVFIVHGRDNKPKLELARFLEKELGLNAIILHEQPDKGRTIIEKLEDESLDVGYAFVILTPDDMGGPIIEGNKVKSIRPRARQNVILESGYFMGLLKRNRVCCLYKGDIELPSDMSGIIYKPFRESVKECFHDIVKELKAAGYKIKM